MRREYDLSNARPNTHAERLKESIAIRLDPDTLACFKIAAELVHLPHQTLIELCLKDCAARKRKPEMSWSS